MVANDLMVIPVVFLPPAAASQEDTGTALLVSVVRTAKLLVACHLLPAVAICICGTTEHAVVNRLMEVPHIRLNLLVGMATAHQLSIGMGMPA